MQKKKLIIYGIGRFARYAAYVFNTDSSYIVDSYSVESSLIENKSDFFDSSLEYTPFEQLNQVKSPQEHLLFISVGNNLVRERLYLAAKQQGFELATYISSKASTWPNLDVGENCFIGEGSVLQPFVKVGSNSILLSSRLGHHTEVGQHTLLSGTLLAGNVKVGDYSLLGLNSAIMENIKIGARNILGMGTVITSDTEDNAIYTAPASVKRSTTFQEFYRDLL
ncbi:acetyltransferase [Antarcticibacterium sp. 1MA-6-2]|uniref:acetyltransferase n=1 Tax=Antarcticibacterium sp. 1MA-6-2 TaxID=2908210 RepID=UPI001F1C723A|nr:acetyltransferase [Antarcticibacterium sp. 1MA-6-2]UJH91330.1 acetyltransferase [Antarcticibacterium sp. 1MA-6-2]